MGERKKFPVEAELVRVIGIFLQQAGQDIGGFGRPLERGQLFREDQLQPDFLLRRRIEFQGGIVGRGGRRRLALRGIEVRQFFCQHRAAFGEVERLKEIDDRGHGRAFDEIYVGQVQIGPFQHFTMTTFQHLVLMLRRGCVRMIQRIADHGGLPGERALRGAGGLAEGEAKKSEPRNEHGQVRRAGQIRFVHGTHRGGRAFREQRADPTVRGAADVVAAVRMKVVGKRAGHELHLGSCERAGRLLVIPAAVEGDLAHGKFRRERGGVGVHDGFKAPAPGEVCRAAQHVIAGLVTRISDAAQIKIRAAPEAVGLRRDGFVHQVAGDVRRRPVQPRDHQHAVGGMKGGRVCIGEQWISQRAAEQQVLFDLGQQGQFTVHGGDVAAEFGPDIRQRGFLDRWVFRDAHRHAVAQHEVADAGLFHDPFEVRAVAVGAGIHFRADMPQARAFEGFRERPLQFAGKFRAGHFDAGAEIETENLVRRHLPPVGVMLGDAFGFGHAGVIDHHHFIARIRRAQGNGGEGEK